jgi:hypothetical protein
MLDRNMVQSIKSLREHRFALPGKRSEAKVKTGLEESASLAGDKFGGEGAYVDNICNEKEFNRLTKLIEEATASAGIGSMMPSMRSQVLSKLQSVSDLLHSPAVQKGQLKKGKNVKSGDVSKDNVISGKRGGKSRDEGSSSIVIDNKNDLIGSSSIVFDNKNDVIGQGFQTNIKKGDVVSLPASAFDGLVPGSYSEVHPEPCMGHLMAINKSGLAKVKWLETGETQSVRLKDLKKEIGKYSSSMIIVMLVEGEQVAFQSQDKNLWPKNFFELLVKSDWRR